MKKLFKNMRMGTIFEIETGDPEFDHDVYKVSSTEYVRVYDASYRETVDDASAEFTVRGRIKVSPSQVTEVERVAITLLYHAAQPGGEIQHPGFRAWLHEIGTNGDFRTYINDWAGDQPELLEKIADDGFEWPNGRWGNPGFAGQLYGDDRNYRPEYRRYHEQAAFQLALGIISYRMNGRPSGDQTHTIQGMGGSSLMNVSTSLAASIAEYHERVRQYDYLDRTKTVEALEDKIYALKK